MIIVYTKIDAPKPAFVAAEVAKGNRILHIPALQYRATGIPLNLSECDAAFVGSPRAAVLAKVDLQNFNGPVFTGGTKTAQYLIQQGISVAAASDDAGATVNFPRFLKIRKVKCVAWISAAETAANLAQIEAENGISIVHFPIYETSAAPVDENKMQSLVHPVEWYFYSGKAVKALIRFVQKKDVVKLFGISAEKAFEREKLSL